MNSGVNCNRLAGSQHRQQGSEQFKLLKIVLDSALVLRLEFSKVRWVFFLHLQLDGHYGSPASNFVKTNQSYRFLFLQLPSS